jgi:hypothetical protein
VLPGWSCRGLYNGKSLSSPDLGLVYPSRIRKRQTMQCYKLCPICNIRALPNKLNKGGGSCITVCAGSVSAAAKQGRPGAMAEAKMDALGDVL